MKQSAKNNKKVLAFTTVAVIVLIITAICLIFIDNRNLDYEYYEINGHFAENRQLKIVHLSDLHFPRIKAPITQMTETLASERPDLIAITGDLIDGSANIESCGVVPFIEKIKDIAPIFFVTGNHDIANHENAAKLRNVLNKNGVTTLANESVNINVAGIKATIIGLNDNADYEKKYINSESANNFKILLAHRPEKWNNYISQDNEYKPNLILSGHAHGGQFRFFNKGLYAPSQGFFPKYDGGIYSSDDKLSHMVVSRGIGNSRFPFRFNNKPNIPIIIIK